MKSVLFPGRFLSRKKKKKKITEPYPKNKACNPGIIYKENLPHSRVTRKSHTNK